MSSDREKFECLKQWKEVGDYIFEDKRDSIKIGELLQTIIDDPLRALRFSSSDDAAFIEELQKKTMTGKIKWYFMPSWDSLHFADGRVRQDIIDSMKKDKVYSFNKETNEQYLIYKSDHIRIRSTIDGKLARTICLSRKDNDFFDQIFESAKASQ